MALDLVTGAGGFSGSHVVRMLLEQGRKVLATDREAGLASARNGGWAQVGVDPDHPNLQVIPADLLAPETLDPLFERKPSRIFHVASLYDYSASLERLRRVNVEGTRNFLERATRADGLDRFVHWSTCGVFGKPYPASTKHNNLPFTEDSSSPRNTPPDAVSPDGTYLVNAYSVSKWEQEKLVWDAHREQGLPLTVVRPAPVYGPGSDYGHNGIILAIARGLVPVIPMDARNAITTSVHVEDIAGFAIFAADRPETLGEDYNVVDDSIISYSEFLHAIALLVGRRMWDVPMLPLPLVRSGMTVTAKTWTWLERTLGIPRVRVLEVQSAVYIGKSYWISNRKSQDAGYRYRYPDVREGLKDTVTWMRDVQWL